MLCHGLTLERHHCVAGSDILGANPPAPVLVRPIDQASMSTSEAGLSMQSSRQVKGVPYQEQEWCRRYSGTEPLVSCSDRATQYKIVVLGSGGVGKNLLRGRVGAAAQQQAGKSAITVQFVQGVFVEKCKCSDCVCPLLLTLPCSR